MGHTFGTEYKKSLPNPRSQRFSPVFFLHLYNFRTYIDIIKTLIYFYI